MPNFISIEMPPRPRQDGYIESPKIDVKDLTRTEAEEYAELMKQTFLEHWHSKQRIVSDVLAKENLES